VTLTVELACAGKFMPSLKMAGNGLVKQRALGVARVVEFAAMIWLRKAKSPNRCRFGLLSFDSCLCFIQKR